jgi:hypothetical protein
MHRNRTVLGGGSVEELIGRHLRDATGLRRNPRRRMLPSNSRLPRTVRTPAWAIEEARSGEERATVRTTLPSPKGSPVRRRRGHECDRASGENAALRSDRRGRSGALAADCSSVAKGDLTVARDAAAEVRAGTQEGSSCVDVLGRQRPQPTFSRKGPAHQVAVDSD